MKFSRRRLLAVSAAATRLRATAIPLLARAQAILPWLVEQRRDLHRHPELLYDVHRTAGVVADRLRSLGVEQIRTGVGKTGVTGVIRGARPGPTIALRADMDALPIDESNYDVPYRSTKPGVKHACGHDAHTTMLLGAAEILQSLRAELAGSVKLIFQPAEEGGRGAEAMIQDGALDNPKVEAIFGQHVWPGAHTGHLEWCPGAFMASSDLFTITIRGKNAHGARPEDGVDSVVVAAQAISALQAIRSRRIATTHPLVLTIGQIQGGTAPNIIAGEVSLNGTMRTLNSNVRDQVVTLMHQTLKGVTEGFGASYDLTIRANSTITYNDPGLTARMVPVFQSLLGTDNVRQIGPQMVAEDFSFYQKVVPGLFYFLGIRNETKRLGIHPLHTPEFDLDEDAMAYGVAAFVALALNYPQTA